MTEKEEACGAEGPNGTTCEKYSGHENDPQNKMHHAPKRVGAGGHFWFGEYKVVRNRESVWNRTSS